MGLTEGNILMLFLSFLTVFALSIAVLIRKEMDWRMKIFWLLLMVMVPFLGILIFWGFHFSGMLKAKTE